MNAMLRVVFGRFYRCPAEHISNQFYVLYSILTPRYRI